ncbi:MAG: universal stress protein [Planctomycetaceae bacterium]|nr:universal stress protein [Planctomycetaceae bacterium]
MQLLQNILVGLDLHHGDRIASPDLEAASQAALDQAVELAKVSGARLTLCSVLELSEQAHQLIDVDHANLHRTVEDAAHIELNQHAERLRAEGLTVDVLVRIGKSWQELAQQAQSGRHDLVVVGTRKRGTAARMLFGSTSHKLLRSGPAPVWIAKPGEVRELREVLVASDFSDASLVALQAGVAAAGALNAKLFLVHALEFPFEAYMRTAGVSEQQVADYRKKMHAEAQHNLQQHLHQTDYRTVQPGVKIEVIEGQPDDVIPKFIDDNEIDLLVIATHGRSGFSGLLLGNTAERILPHAHCSLLVTRPPAT